MIEMSLITLPLHFDVSQSDPTASAARKADTPPSYSLKPAEQEQSLDQSEPCLYRSSALAASADIETGFCYSTRAAPRGQRGISFEGIRTQPIASQTPTRDLHEDGSSTPVVNCTSTLATLLAGLAPFPTHTHTLHRPRPQPPPQRSPPQSTTSTLSRRTNFVDDAPASQVSIESVFYALDSSGVLARTPSQGSTFVLPHYSGTSLSADDLADYVDVRATTPDDPEQEEGTTAGRRQRGRRRIWSKLGHKLEKLFVVSDEEARQLNRMYAAHAMQGTGFGWGAGYGYNYVAYAL